MGAVCSAPGSLSASGSGATLPTLTYGVIVVPIMSDIQVAVRPNFFRKVITLGMAMIGGLAERPMLSEPAVRPHGIPAHVDDSWLDARWAKPSDPWGGGGAVAFPVAQV